MSQSPQTPADREARRSDADTAPAKQPGAGADATWQAPWVGTPAEPQGAADVPAPPQSAPGHYGPGYADPTRHYGGTLPGRPGDAPAPGREGDHAETPSTGVPAAAAAAAGRGVPAAGEHPSVDPERPPDFRSDEVGVRPPDHAPSPSAPASENAGLIFERS